MWYKLTNTISLILLMLVTGVFWGTWFTLTRSLSDFSISEFIHIGKVIIANVGLPMRFLMPLCILIMALTLWVFPERKTIAFYLNMIAFVLIVATLCITLTVLVPIDNEIKLWTPETAPQNWEEIRNRWEYFHSLRTITSVSSFICFVLSGVIKNNVYENTRA
jgi:uncharacterized membrane protein